MLRFKDKVALITGGAGGIGTATAMRLVSEGARVVVADINGDGAREVAAQIGAAAVGVTLDAGDEDSFRDAVQHVMTIFGRIDVLFNNAALVDAQSLAHDTTATEIPIELWTRTLHVNLTGYLIGCRQVIPHMKAAGGGVIVNMASGAGQAADSSRIAYGTSKAGVIALTQYVATQYGASRIRCNGIAPGPIVTPKSLAMAGDLFAIIARHTLMGDLGTPEDAAALVAFLAADDSRYINGQIINLDGGMMAHHAHLRDMEAFLAALPPP